MKRKISLLCIIAMLVFSGIVFSQTSIGGHLGGGVISANSPNEFSFTSSLFIETYLSQENLLSTRLTFFYAGDFNMLLLKSSTIRYYPFIRGISLKGIFVQYFNYKIYIEEGLGGIVIDNRIFSGEKEIDYGVVFSLLAGMDLREDNFNGFRIGAGIEYGLTFTGESPKYFSLHFQTQYLF
jgi:hypothetical protein